jgi:hypothetical protein
MITPARKDHSSRFSLSEPTIKEIADKVRVFLDSGLRPDFDVAAALEYLANRPCFSWGTLRIAKFHALEGEDLTFVQLTPGGKTLHVDEELWEDARIGEPNARFMLAHELGHLVLHDCYVQPYSDEKRSIYGEGSSTEWQAHTFARYFLLHDSHLELEVTPLKIAMTCSVAVSLVRKRLGRRVSSVDGLCRSCGSENIFLVDNVKTCADCGAIA